MATGTTPRWLPRGSQDPTGNGLASNHHARVHVPRPGLAAPRHGPAVGRPRELGAGRGGDRRTPTATSARLLLDADADELKDTRNAQLCTFVTSLMVLDAVERSASNRASAPATASASTPRSRPPALSPSTTACASCASGPRRCTTPASTTPARWPPCSASTTTTSRSPAVGPTSDVWVANFNAPGQVVIAGSAEGVTRGGRGGQGAGRQEGHAAAGVRRVPHAVHDPGAGPPAQGHRRGQPARHRRADRLQRRRAPPRPGQRVGQPAVGAALQPGALEALPAGAVPARASRTTSSSARAACSPA